MGIYVSIAGARSVERVADTTTPPPGGGGAFSSFDFAPSCAAQYIAFYAFAGAVGGVWLAAVGGGPAAATVRPLVTVSQNGDGTHVGGVALRSPPQAAGAALYVPRDNRSAPARLCFFAELANDTVGVYAADFAQP